jgi:hypothetical protein
MSHEELLVLLSRSRALHERYLFDGDVMRDDVAEICMAIDDALSGRSHASARPESPPLERSAA